ncbi:MAG: helix-turn-helix domain-containing protein [Bifidobacteriaceae bacterium]|jgi:excisionase family DNA binding protein|nr:helix-turn-helix domain-containing protein [Bifidobacteriaceae bacterium]
MVPAAPAIKDTQLAQAALAELGQAHRTPGQLRLRLVRDGTDEEDLVLPNAAVDALADVLKTIAHGESARVVPIRAELTTQQAADILGVSRPYLIKLLNAGDIEFRNVGTHRRVSASSLQKFKRADDAKRHDFAALLSSETYEMGLA